MWNRREREREGKETDLKLGGPLGREREKIHSKSIAKPRHTHRERNGRETHGAITSVRSVGCFGISVEEPSCLPPGRFESRSLFSSSPLLIYFWVFFLREELLICVLKHISCFIPKRELV